MRDVQGYFDERNIKIDEVGVSEVYAPFLFLYDGKKQNIMPKIEMTVDLDASSKGTHMSRFIEILNSSTDTISCNDINMILNTMIDRFDSKYAYVKMEFKFFHKVYSPHTNKISFIDIDARVEGVINESKIIKNIYLEIPCATLCPCSKEISSYGAHNQRAKICIDISYDKDINSKFIEEISGLASSKVYPLLKREDEKLVTECAYDNPKFVEDVVRDVKLYLDRERLHQYKISVKSYESIHNHIAIARIVKDEKDSISR